MAATLPPEAVEALQSYAREHGRRWKEALRRDWESARADGERGVILHGLRTAPGFGPRGLIGYRLPPEEITLSPEEIDRATGGMGTPDYGDL